MAHIDEGGDSKSVNVELNIVPFIDLMSCLAAFLLMAAVWDNFKQTPTQPKPAGKTKTQPQDDPKVDASVLVQKEGIWVNLTRLQGQATQIPATATGHNWKRFREVMKKHKESEYFQDRNNATMAAEDDVRYEHIVFAIESMAKVGFDDVSLVTPSQLPAKPTL